MYNGMDEFDWDEGNRDKNWVKHGVMYKECEEVFFNDPKVIYKDAKHSFTEKRFGILGKTDKGRFLHIIFTTRKNEIRVISARDQNRRERKFYENETKNIK